MVLIETKWTIIEAIRAMKIDKLIGLTDKSGKERYWLCQSINFPMPKDDSGTLINAIDITLLFESPLSSDMNIQIKEIIQKSEPFRNNFPFSYFSIIQYC